MNILAIGSHPDDIEFGCGGTLHRLASQGHAASILIMTQGDVGGDPAVRKVEQEKSACVLKVNTVFWGGYRDTRISFEGDVIKTVERVVNETRPDLVFTHAPDDTHQDHRFVNACVLSATRHVKSVLFFEVPTTIDFTPNIFSDIQGSFEAKLEALRAHASQIHKTNIADLSILRIAEALANFRGTQARVKTAEGFRSPRMLLSLCMPGCMV